MEGGREGREGGGRGREEGREEGGREEEEKKQHNYVTIQCESLGGF